jgi:hypothetical protein
MATLTLTWGAREPCSPERPSKGSCTLPEQSRGAQKGLRRVSEGSCTLPEASWLASMAAYPGPGSRESMEMAAQQCLQPPPRCGQATQWDPPARRRQHVEAFKASAELARAHSDRGEHAAWAGRVAEVMGQNGITIDLQSPQPIPARHAKQQFLLCILFSNLATLQAPRTGPM